MIHAVKSEEVLKKENESEFCIKINIKNKAGVLRDTVLAFQYNNVSILSVTQDVWHQDYISLLIITYKSTEKNIKNSLKKIKKLKNVNKIESIIRVEA